MPTLNRRSLFGFIGAAPFVPVLAESALAIEPAILPVAAPGLEGFIVTETTTRAIADARIEGVIFPLGVIR